MALYATVRTSERETLFKWVGPLATVSTSFYAKRGAGLRITQLAEAKGSRSGNMVHVWSSYASSPLRWRAFFRGVNSIMLFHDGKRWCIMG